MSATKFVVLLACLAACSGLKVRRSAPEPPGLLQQMQGVLSDQYKQLTESKNAQHFNEVVRAGADSVLHQLKGLSAALQSALSDASGKAREALEQTRVSLERTAEELRKAHPDVEKQAAALGDKLQVALQNTMKESEKLAKEVAANVEQTNEKLAPKVKAAFDDFAKHAAELQKKLRDAADKH